MSWCWPAPVGQPDDLEAVAELAVGGLEEGLFEASGLGVGQLDADHGGARSEEWLVRLLLLRTVMAIGMATRPHENGGERSVILFGSGRGNEAVLGLVRSARNEHGPTSARLTSNPTLSPPAAGGARRGNCSNSRGHPAGPDTTRGTAAMDLIHPCCAGLDVHKKTVVACVRRVGPDGRVGREVRTYGTMTGRPDRAGRLARRRGRQPRRHGVDRGVLEAGLPPPGGPVRGPAGQRPAHQAGARAARPTSRTPSGSPSCSSTACCRPASSRRRRSASCAT